MSAAEIFDALAFLRACCAVIGWDDTDYFWFVRLQKCLHATSVLENPPAFDLPVFENGV